MCVQAHRSNSEWQSSNNIPPLRGSSFGLVWEADKVECCCCSAIQNLLCGPKHTFYNDITNKKTNKQTTFGLIWLGDWSGNHRITLLFQAQFGFHNKGVRTTNGLKKT